MVHGKNEAFKDSYIRFRKYQRDCPLHDYSEPQIVRILFRGLNLNYQTSLDIASDGNLNTRSPEDAKRLIKNMASSDSFKGLILG